MGQRLSHLREKFSETLGLGPVIRKAVLSQFLKQLARRMLLVTEEVQIVTGQLQQRRLEPGNELAYRRQDRR